jgi:hypothetical protein
MCVINHSFTSPLWRDIRALIAVSGHSTVMCVISHSISSLIWRYISALIVVRGHFTVMCVISHSVNRWVWRDINALIAVSGHLAEMCVTRHCILSMTWSHIPPFMVICVSVCVRAGARARYCTAAGQRQTVHWLQQRGTDTVADSVFCTAADLLVVSYDLPLKIELNLCRTFIVSLDVSNYKCSMEWAHYVIRPIQIKGTKYWYVC